MSLPTVIRSLFTRQDPVLTPLLRENATLPVDRLTERVLRASTLREISHADMLIIAPRCGLDGVLSAELDDETLIEGLATLLGRELGRRIGNASADFYGDVDAGAVFLGGPVFEAVEAYHAAMSAAGAKPNALAAFTEAVLTQTARIHVQRHSPSVYRVPIRRAEQILRYDQLQDALDLLRNARQAITLHKEPTDAVSLAYQAQVCIFVDVIEALRLRKATERAVEAINTGVEANVAISAARSEMRCTFPFTTKQRTALQAVISESGTSDESEKALDNESIRRFSPSRTEASGGSAELARAEIRTRDLPHA